MTLPQNASAIPSHVWPVVITAAVDFSSDNSSLEFAAYWVDWMIAETF